jgi:hypothetical protein
VRSYWKKLRKRSKGLKILLSIKMKFTIDPKGHGLYLSNKRKRLVRKRRKCWE